MINLSVSAKYVNTVSFQWRALNNWNFQPTNQGFKSTDLKRVYFVGASKRGRKNMCCILCSGFGNGTRPENIGRQGFYRSHYYYQFILSWQKFCP